MTVHGAKGLEAPVVDAGRHHDRAGGTDAIPAAAVAAARIGRAARIRRRAWPGCRKKLDDTGVTAAARARAITASENEYRRLLYVAMTRAADRLVVCGSIGEKAAPRGCWYELIDQGLSASGILIDEAGRRRRDDREALPQVRAGHGRCASAAARDACSPRRRRAWLTQAVTETARVAPIKPSRLRRRSGGVRTCSDAREARRRALARGNIVHRLMQSLPEVPHDTRRGCGAPATSRAQDTDFSETEREEIAEPGARHSRPTRASLRCLRRAAAPRCRSSAGVGGPHR